MPSTPFIDAHTHFFSRPFFEDLAQGSPFPGSVEARLESLSRSTGIEIPDPDTQVHLQQWLRAIADHGVDHAVTFASAPSEADVVAQAIAAAKGKLSGYALVNPCAEAAATETRKHFEARKFRGILLFPAMHHFHMSDACVDPVLDVIAAHRGMAVVHCGMLQVKLRDLLGLPRPMDLSYANPLDLIPVANAFPEVSFVIPHFGAGYFRECLMVGTMCENVYVDTSSSNAWIATQAAPITIADVFRRSLDVFGPDRILFGTDSSVFPRGWRSDLFDEQRAALQACGASNSDQACIFGGNAERLLSVKA